MCVAPLEGMHRARGIRGNGEGLARGRRGGCWLGRGTCARWRSQSNGRNAGREGEVHTSQIGEPTWDRHLDSGRCEQNRIGRCVAQCGTACFGGTLTHRRRPAQPRDAGWSAPRCSRTHARSQNGCCCRSHMLARLQQVHTQVHLAAPLRARQQGLLGLPPSINLRRWFGWRGALGCRRSRCSRCRRRRR